jgi:hypothetical protein
MFGTNKNTTRENSDTILDRVKTKKVKGRFLDY